MGLLFDNSIWGWVNELLRSVVCFLAYHKFGGWKGFIVPAYLINILYGISLAISAISIAAYFLTAYNKGIKEETNNGKKQKQF